MDTEKKLELKKISFKEAASKDKIRVLLLYLSDYD